MQNSAAVDFQSRQIDRFMADITKDLEDHVLSKSAKYAFDFQTETPFKGPDRDYEWFKVSKFSKSEATGNKPRMNLAQDRKSTAYTTLHSIQQEIPSARGNANTPFLFSEASQVHINHQRQSSAGSVTHYSAQQMNAVQMKRPDFVGRDTRISEERESISSQSQLSPIIECGRESLAELPGDEGRARDPGAMPVSTPFAVQSSNLPQRQIPISNYPVRGVGDSAQGQREEPVRPGGMLMKQFGQMQLESGPKAQEQHLDTEQEFDQACEQEAARELNGPSEAARQFVYLHKQPHTNIQSLDQSSQKVFQASGPGKPASAGQNQ